MRRGSMISFGPGAASLILIVVILSMSVLGILALMSANSDARLSERSVAVITAVYDLNGRAEKSRANLDDIAARCREKAADDEGYLAEISGRLPENMSLDGREISWVESDGLRTLECAVEVLPLDADQRLRWTSHSLTATTEEVWN